MTDMRLQKLLIEKKTAILNKWIDRVLGTYPEDGAKFLKRQIDQFANPIGSNAAQTFPQLYNALLGEGDFADIPAILEHHIQIRAVQQFSPSGALAFIYLLKDIVKEECRKGLKDLGVEEWQSFEEKVDAMAFIAFDQYMVCRERIFKARIQEYESGNHIVVKGGCPSTAMRRNKA